MIDHNIQIKIDRSTELLNEARVDYEQSNYDEAERCANEVLELLESESERDDLGDERAKGSQKNLIIELLAHTYNRLHTIFYSKSDYTLALKQAEIGIAFSERIRNFSRKSSLLTCIGNVYQHLSDTDRALEYYHKSLILDEELGNKAGVASNLGNIGNVYFNRTDYTRALEYQYKALALDEELGNQQAVASWLTNIGSVHQKLSEYPLALEFYSKALALAENLGNKKIVAASSANLGVVYAEEDFDGYNAVKAEEYLLKGLAIIEDLGMRRIQYEQHRNIAEFYEKQKRWEESATHFKRYHIIEKEVNIEDTRKQVEQRESEKQLAIERAEAATVKRILHNTLPPIIADRLINNETFIADSYPNVSVLFMDLVNFTRIAAIIPPRHLIYLLNTIFSNADAVMEKHGLEKIKTIGDAYMAVAGAPVHQDDHAQRAALAAIDVMEAMNNLSVTIPQELGETSWTSQVGEIQVRIGLHRGEAIGGVIGDKKFTFDLWGDAVNTAARMESHGEAGKIHVSEEFRSAVVSTSATPAMSTPHLEFIERGEMEIKGKGKMKTYFLERADGNG